MRTEASSRAETRSQPLRVAFVSPLARPLFDADCNGDVGGSEVRAFTFARTIAARRNCRVQFCVRSSEVLPSRMHDGIELHYELGQAPIPRVRDIPMGWRWPVKAIHITAQRWSRSLRKRWESRKSPSVNPHAFYANLDADAVCCFGVNDHSASVIAAAGMAGRKTILFLACDGDISESYYEGSTFRNEYGHVGHSCYFAIRHADRIVAQTLSQQLLLQKRFGRDSVLIRNPISLTGQDPPPPADQAKPYVLWVGRAESFHKRAHLCPELARQCPEIRFVMIVNKNRRGMFEQIVRQAPPNVSVIERVPYAEIDSYFRHATALVNTSGVEGFPNSFLQAAKYGVPILSLDVDPGRMLTKHGCGAVAARRLESLAETLRSTVRDESRRAKMSMAGRKYVRDYHDADDRAAELESLVIELTSRARNASGVSLRQVA
jgi:glycosyltransferase involved in cell wall biosynthesis